MTASATAHRFTEKVCVVTGAGGGIGSAIARRLASEGATVVVCDVDGATADKVATEITGGGGRAEVSRFDLADAEAVALTRRGQAIRPDAEDAHER
jgi:NAD(P)-dependent dehydrogenase (short-subunit alcohol dehydrogenase family)